MEQKYYKHLGGAIREIRRSKNISQDYMASKLNISQNMYSKIELGKCKCDAYRLVNIMDLLRENVLDMKGFGIIYIIDSTNSSEELGGESA